MHSGGSDDGVVGPRRRSAAYRRSIGASDGLWHLFARAERARRAGRALVVVFRCGRRSRVDGAASWHSASSAGSTLLRAPIGGVLASLGDAASRSASFAPLSCGHGPHGATKPARRRRWSTDRPGRVRAARSTERRRSRRSCYGASAEPALAARSATARSATGCRGDARSSSASRSCRCCTSGLRRFRRFRSRSSCSRSLASRQDRSIRSSSPCSDGGGAEHLRGRDLRGGAGRCVGFDSARHAARRSHRRDDRSRRDVSRDRRALARSSSRYGFFNPAFRAMDRAVEAP